MCIRDRFKTKWLYIGAGILGLLGIGIYVLQFVVFGQNAEAMAKAVSDAHERGNWAETTKRCDEMIKAYPGHKDIPVVRAKRVQSILRSKFQAKSYGEMITQADLLLKPLSDEEDTKIETIRDDMSVILPRGLDEITSKAAKKMVVKTDNDVEMMETELSTIMEYKKVIDNPIYVSGVQRKKQVLAEVLSLSLIHI